MRNRKVFHGKMIIAGVILAAGLLAACGNRPGKADEAAAVDGSAPDGSTAKNGGLAGQRDREDGDGTGQAKGSGGKEEGAQGETGRDSEKGENAETTPFDYNHGYNEIIRYYENNLYLSREDGIYLLEGGEGEGKLIFQNPYILRRGMEIDQGFLYFCGSVIRGNEETSTVYRMDLGTLEVKDALAAFSRKFEFLHDLSIYDGKLYVSDGEGQKTGFELDREGNAGRQLDSEAEDFLYREYNEYMELEAAKWNGAEEEEYGELAEEQAKKYQAVMDVAVCKRMLQGVQVVSRYKDELLQSIYLEYENGVYEYLCDAVDFPMLVTETGLYYAAEESGEIWYVDFNTKSPEKIFARGESGWSEISLVNYDADYIYLLQKRYAGEEGGNARDGEVSTNREVNRDGDTSPDGEVNQDGEASRDGEASPDGEVNRDGDASPDGEVGQDGEASQDGDVSLYRVPRRGGEAQEVYRIEDAAGQNAANGWYGNCGVYNGRMFFADSGPISLVPAADGSSIQ